MRKLSPFILLLVWLCTGICTAKENPENCKGIQKRWSQERIQSWYQEQSWLVGCNFTPSSAVNQLEMWQEDTFDPDTIDRELEWASDIGFNIIRVYLHDMLWQQDRKGFIKRIDRFLTIADKHRIKVMFVFLDSCWNPHPRLGRQDKPKPHVHNSGWVQSPHIEVLKDINKHDLLKDYVKGIISHFQNDNRVLVWDLYNEPDNTNRISYGQYEPSNKSELSLALLKKAFEWARQVNPKQPITSDVWAGLWEKGGNLNPINRFTLDNSDIITFHSYRNPKHVQLMISQLLEYKRPIICTEYMSRKTGCTFQNILPIFKKHGIGAINWGLVAGKTQTNYPWDSWTKKYTSEPELWFHDIFRVDGTPYRRKEVDYIRKILISENAAAIQVEIDPRKKGREINPLFFGVCLMYHVENDNDMSDGLIEQYLKQLPCTSLRFPGGTISDNYLWDKHCLHDKTRWPFKDGPETMDTDEFISLCKRTQAEPVLCVNTELAFFESPEKAVKLAAEWVRYCNKIKNYGVKYWEIGNEPYFHTRFDAKEYAQLYVKMARAMKAVDPSIMTAATGPWGVDSEGMKARIPQHLLKEAQAINYKADQGNWPYRKKLWQFQTLRNSPSWWPVVLETAGEQIDMVSIHWYCVPEKHLPAITKDIEKLRSLCQNKIPGKNIPIIMTEWNTARWSWYKAKGIKRALAMGEGVGRILDAGISMAHFWPLICSGEHEVKNLLHRTNKTPTANYKVLQLFAKYIGRHRISSKSNNQSVYHFASIKNTGEPVVFIINRNGDEKNVSLKINGYKGGTVDTRMLKSKDDPSSEEIILEEKSKIITGDTLNVLMPRFSMYQLTFKN